VFPRFSSLDEKIMIEKALTNETAFIRQLFSNHDSNIDVRIVGIEPTEEEIAGVAELSRTADCTVLFCFDAHLYPSNKKLLDDLSVFAKNLCVILLRDPYDAEFVQKKIPCATGFGWRVCQINASVDKLFNGD